MSGSDGDDDYHTIAWLTAFVLIVVAGSFGWSLSEIHTKESIQADAQSSKYEKDTQQQIAEGCTVAEQQALIDCITEKIKASQENQRATQDLVAQNRSARYAMGTFCLGLAGTMLTVVGIFFLQRNLTEMKRQRLVSSAALDAAKAQTRAYLGISHVEIVEDGRDSVTTAQLLYGGGDVIVQTDIFFKNSGATPARNVTVNTDPYTVKRDSLKTFDRTPRSGRVDAADSVLAGAMFRIRREDLIPVDHYLELRNDTSVTVILIDFSYYDVFGEKFEFRSPIISSQYGRKNARFSPWEEQT